MKCESWKTVTDKREARACMLLLGTVILVAAIAADATMTSSSAGPRRIMPLYFGVAGTGTHGGSADVTAASCYRLNKAGAPDILDLEVSTQWHLFATRQVAYTVPPGAVVEDVWFRVTQDTSVTYASGGSLTYGVFTNECTSSSCGTLPTATLSAFTLSSAVDDNALLHAELNHSMPNGGQLAFCIYGDSGSFDASGMNGMATVTVSVP